MSYTNMLCLTIRLASHVCRCFIFYCVERIGEVNTLCLLADRSVVRKHASSLILKHHLLQNVSSRKTPALFCFNYKLQGCFRIFFNISLSD